MLIFSMVCEIVVAIVDYSFLCVTINLLEYGKLIKH